MDSLESRAKEAEEQLAQTQREREETMASLKDATAQVENLQDQRSQLEGELSNLRRQQEEAAKSMQEMQASLRQMRASMKDLETEKETLQSRLQGALSKVAETKESARGYIVNLPDILFDVGKATLKPDAQLVLAKLAGILLVMTDLNVRVEGHTDSTGSAEFNLKLSQDRAGSVATLLSTQGVDAARIQTAGYGMDRPVADNSTAAGRQKNRRVEIIIAEGEISAQ
jgi:outer membrane protein OmpA-like peptidoglycan-associated protein